jgi:ABC-2 type transport system permease protein
MSALVRSELLKLRTVPRTGLALLLGLLAVIGLGTAGTVDSDVDSPLTVGILRDVISAASPPTVFFALVLGILVVTWEYRHGTITQTFLVAPVRERVLLAKAFAALVMGAAIGAVAVAAGFAVAIPWLAIVDRGAELGDGGLWLDAGRVLTEGALWAAFGVAVGALIRNQAGAIAVALLWFLVAEPLIGAAFDRVGDYVPAAATASLVGWDDAPLSPARGAIVTLAYALVLGVAAVLSTRRDVT